MMAAEAEFDREAAHMLRNMGLEDADTLNFFQSDILAPGNDKWKEGLRKPSAPRLRRPQSLAHRANRTEVDGQAMRKHLQINGTHSSRKMQVHTSTHVPANTQPSPSYGYHSHQHVGRTKSMPENGKQDPGHSQSVVTVNSERRSSLSPPLQYTHYPSSTTSSSAAAATRTSKAFTVSTAEKLTRQPDTANKPTTIVKVKSTHIPVPVPRPVPASVAKLSAVGSKPVASSATKTTVIANEPQSVSSSSSGTKVLYARKPTLKLLSVTTSTSAKVQSVADRSSPKNPSAITHGVQSSSKHPPPATFQYVSPKSRQDHSTTSVSSGIPQLKQPPASTIPVNPHLAYDRLEGYREIVLSSPELPNNETTSFHPVAPGITRIASPTRSSSVNSNASQGSNVSQKSTGSSGLSERRRSSQSSIPRSRRQSAPPGMTGSGSSSRTPTPTTGLTHMRKSSSNSSGEFYYATTDDSSQESAKSPSLLPGSANIKGKSVSEPKLSLDDRTTSASPDPEIVTMSILATNTVQALGTLMEVVTPATSTENLEGKASQTQTPTKTEHRYSLGTSSPAAQERQRVPESVIKQASTTEIRSSSDTLIPPELNRGHIVNESTTIHGPSPASVAAKNPPVLSSKGKSSIPTPSQPFPSKQRKAKPPPIPTKQNRTKRDKPPPLIPTEKRSSLQDSNHTGSIIMPVANVPTPHMNGEQHNTNPASNERSNISLEDEDDFFGYCNQCGRAVVGEESGCLALGKVFHTACLSCSNCLKPLSGKTFYTVGTNILCEVDYQKSLQRCCFCNQKVKDKVLRAFGEVYHPHCFRCAACGECLDGVPYAGQSHDKVYCIKDYHMLYAPPCAACGDPIVPQPGKAKNVRVIANDRYYHVKCYKCEDCGKLFASSSIVSGAKKPRSVLVDGHLFCLKCHKEHTEGHVRTTIL